MVCLEPGFRVVNAPRFHLTRSLSDRLCVNSGVIVETDRIAPRDDWRPLADDEASFLIGAEGDDALAIFNISDRLRADWWTLAGREASATLENTAFEQYARSVLDYLHFKQLPLPAACAVEAVIQAPGQQSTRPNQAGLLAQRSYRHELGIINLGDEVSFLVFLNLAEAQLGKPLHDRAWAFFTERSDYSIVRLSLWPGEGCWLPEHPMIFDGDTRGRNEADVQLVLSPARHSDELHR